MVIHTSLLSILICTGQMAYTPCYLNTLYIGGFMGVRGENPPRSRKNCCRKMVLFPNALFLVTNFPKIIQKMQFFYCIFIKNFQIFLKISQQFVFFVQTCEKIKQGLLNYFEKYAQIIIFRLKIF